MRKVVVVLILIGSWGCALGAETYWAVSDGSVEVLAEGSEKNAVAMIARLRQLDTAMSVVLGIKLNANGTPTNIYSITPMRLEQIGLGKDMQSTFVSTALDANIIINTRAASDRRYWGAYFGYSGSKLASAAGLRLYPSWLRLGVSQVFAATSMSDDEVTLGGFETMIVRQLYQAREAGKLIPMQTLMNLSSEELQAKPVEYRTQYQAQTWFLAHLILIEGMERKQFGNYLSLVADGGNAQEAFAASFPGGYAGLDAEFRSALQRGTLQTLIVKAPFADSGIKPIRLTESDVLGRLAELMVRGGNMDRGMVLASQALKTDPRQEFALRAMMVGSMRLNKMSDAWSYAIQMQQMPMLSARAESELGVMLGRMAMTDIWDGPVGQEQVRSVAIKQLEKGIKALPDDVPSWMIWAQLKVKDADREGINRVVDELENVLAQFPTNDSLIALIANLHMQSGNNGRALQFARLWLRVAAAAASRQAAIDMITRIEEASGSVPSG